MINRVELKNFGPIEELDWALLGKINLVIGNNGCGKSFLLKGLYSAMKTIEEYKRGDSPEFQSFDEILRIKLWWTFQAEKIGDLVNKKNNFPLLLKMIFDDQIVAYSFNKDTVKEVNTSETQVKPRIDNSIYLPAKEVLSLHQIILKTREQVKQFGFDDTYLDLARALSLSSLEPIVSEGQHLVFLNSGNSVYKLKCNIFNETRKLLEDTIGGVIEFDDVKKRWYFRKGEERFPMGVTAEGIKKVAILDTLLSNGYLSENSIIFIDEPESNLHPEMITKFLDIITLLAQQGMQIFIASHSYFVIKKLFLIAQEQQISIPVLSYQNNEWVQSNLTDDLPDNPIIDESIRLYKEEMFMAAR